MSSLNPVFHPIRSFKEDLRTNPLSRLTWGIEPPSRKRRIRASINIGIHAFLYIMCFLLFLFRGYPSIGIRPIYKAGDLLEVGQFSTVSAFLSVLIWGVLLVMIRALNNFPARNLKANWEDYSLAGISGSQMIWGLAGNSIAGIFAGITVFVIIYTSGNIMYGMDYGFNIMYGMDYGFISRVIGSYLITVCVIVFYILTSVFLDLAMWILLPYAVLRLLTMAIFLISMNPLIMTWFVTYFTIPLGATPRIRDDLLVIIEIISWPIRAAIVIWLWRKAVRRLETVGPR